MIDLGSFSHFHFIRPLWLLLLVPAVLLQWLLLRRQDVSRSWKKSISPHLLEHLLVGKDKKKRLRPANLFFPVVFLLILALSGPAWQQEPLPFTEDQAPLVIALDLSQEMKVIDIVATDMSDLIKQLNGRTVNILGKDSVLDTQGLLLNRSVPDWRSRLLGVITNPNVAYILMMIGIYGLILEFSNPGAIVPGTVGAISLLLALYAFQLLPINYAGMGLILLGVALMVGEAFEPSFGILGIGGVVAFVFGSIILIDTKAPGFGIDISVIVTFAATSALVFIFIIGMAMKARRKKVVSGLEELLGGEAIVINGFEQQGTVSIHSEHWQARSNTPLSNGQLVRVIGIKGLTLDVEPIEASSQEEGS